MLKSTIDPGNQNYVSSLLTENKNLVSSVCYAIKNLIENNLKSNCEDLENFWYYDLTNKIREHLKILEEHTQSFNLSIENVLEKLSSFSRNATAVLDSAVKSYTNKPSTNNFENEIIKSDRKIHLYPDNKSKINSKTSIKCGIHEINTKKSSDFKAFSLKLEDITTQLEKLLNYENLDIHKTIIKKLDETQLKIEKLEKANQNHFDSKKYPLLIVVK